MKMWNMSNTVVGTIEVEADIRKELRAILHLGVLTVYAGALD